jgi:uridine monophosphate synthetase
MERDAEGHNSPIWFQPPLSAMGFFTALTEAMTSRQSLLITGLDPNPEMLRNWATPRGLGGSSLLSQARAWCKFVIEATSDHVCAYKPSLGFYQAMGSAGVDLLMEVRELLPPDLPLIIDIKHGDLNSSSAIAAYLFQTLQADAVTLNPFAGQDIAAPFFLYPGKAVVINCHSSNPAARSLQHYPDEERPLYLMVVGESQRWGTPDQLLLEVGTSDPTILGRVRKAAPERFVMLRSLWGEEGNLERLLASGLNEAGDGLLLPLPQSLLNDSNISDQTTALKQRINRIRSEHLEARVQQSQLQSVQCRIWPHADQPSAQSDTANGEPSAQTGTDPELRDLIIDLFDIRCLLFGEFKQASGAIFNYYVDLRQIISDPALFHRVLDCYSRVLRTLNFDRIAGIPYGSLPTATGLSLQLHKPLIYPRKEVKAHGTRRLVEGEFNAGDTVVVVDDILISGGSVLEGIAKLTSSELKVSDVVVFLDHGGRHDPRAKQRLQSEGLRLHAVLTLETISTVLVETGRISTSQAQELNACNN